jgi:predicted transcriptional regulator
MSHTITVELSDEVYEALQRQAQAAGMSPAELVAATLGRQYRAVEGQTVNQPARNSLEEQAARERFERHFGAVNLGHPTGVDNEGIDADLARAYADDHEESP